MPNKRQKYLRSPIGWTIIHLFFLRRFMVVPCWQPTLLIRPKLLVITARLMTPSSEILRTVIQKYTRQCILGSPRAQASASTINFRRESHLASSGNLKKTQWKITIIWKRIVLNCRCIWVAVSSPTLIRWSTSGKIIRRLWSTIYIRLVANSYSS